MTVDNLLLLSSFIRLDQTDLSRTIGTFQVNLTLNVGDALVLCNGIGMHSLRRVCFRLEVTVAVVPPKQGREIRINALLAGFGCNIAECQADPPYRRFVRLRSMPHIDMMKGGLTRLKGRPNRLIFIDYGINRLTARQDIVWVPGIAMRRDTFLVAPAQHAHTAVFLTRLSQCDPNGNDLAAVRTQCAES